MLLLAFSLIFLLVILARVKFLLLETEKTGIGLDVNMVLHSLDHFGMEIFKLIEVNI